MIFERMPALWKDFLKDEFSKDYCQALSRLVLEAYQSKIVFPPIENVFTAFDLCLPNEIKIIILGQDPYHQKNQANGLSFSVNSGIRLPPSLKNIFKEITQDIPDFKLPSSGDLSYWSKQGVLLLNSLLTVEDSKPGSHRNFGWIKFTDAVIQRLSNEKNNLVFLLWGNYAISKSTLIDSYKHLILTAAHPSPLARGAFFGNKHFSKSNSYLKSKGKKEISWQLTL